MSFKLSVTALAVALTSVANAQQTPSSNGAAGQELEPIVVTGSLIKSADKVGFNQVQVVTASDIQATGSMSVQAEILNLLNRMKASHSMTYLLVSHDRHVIAHMCDRAAAMHAGHIERVIGRDELNHINPDIQRNLPSRASVP